MGRFDWLGAGKSGGKLLMCFMDQNNVILLYVAPSASSVWFGLVHVVFT